MLYSKKWLARVYAGQALGVLAQRVEHYTPAILAAKAGITSSDVIGHDACLRDSLASFDSARVLQQGCTLVSDDTTVLSCSSRLDCQCRK